MDEKFPALPILDVFRGQMTNEVTKLLKEKNILFVKVPNNMTHLLHPLDLSVNSWVKRWIRQQFSDWYAEQIRLNLDEGKTLESIDIKMPLTVMKPLHARWLIKLYNTMTTGEGKQVIKIGWEAAGITEAIKISSKNLPSVDPFRNISPINDKIHFEICDSFPGSENRFVNEWDEEDEDSSDWDDGNASDLFD